MKHLLGFRAVRAENGTLHERRKPKSKTLAAMSEMVQDLYAIQLYFCRKAAVNLFGCTERSAPKAFNNIKTPAPRFRIMPYPIDCSKNCLRARKSSWFNGEMPNYNIVDNTNTRYSVLSSIYSARASFSWSL